MEKGKSIATIATLTTLTPLEIRAEWGGDSKTCIATPGSIATPE